MRQKRAKTYKKLMSLYSMTFGFRQPYQVLIDSGICTNAVNSQQDLLKHLYTVLQGEVKPMITQCCIHQLYLQGKSAQAAVDLAKMCERRKCNHKEAIPSDDCLKSVVGETNKHRYVVATDSQPLRVHLRSVPGVPVVHINRSVFVLEPPSDTTLRMKAKNEAESLAPATPAPVGTVDEPKPKKHKGAKGPNPLSVKKKKVTEPPPPKSKPKTTTHIGEKRKREDDEEADSQKVDIRDGEGPRDLQAQVPKKKRRRRKGAGQAVNTTQQQVSDSD